MSPAFVAGYREDAPLGKGEADGQALLGHGVKLLLYKIPSGHRINQLEGMKQEMPIRPDTVEDLEGLRARWESASTDHGSKSLEARRLQARVAALEMYHNPKPVAVPIDSEAGLSKVPVGAMGGDNTDIWIEEEPESKQMPLSFSENEDPDLFGDDHRPLIWAKSYLQWDFSVGKLILREDLPKVPVGDWRQYRETPPSAEQIGEWWGEDDQDGRICIFTGYDGLYVFDFDEAELRRRWQAIVLAKMNVLDLKKVHGQHIARLGVVLTGSGGFHVYVKTDNPLLGGTVLAKGVKGYGHGGLMVAPPSKHETGGRYQWATEYARIPRVQDNIYQLMLDAARQLDE